MTNHETMPTHKPLAELNSIHDGLLYATPAYLIGKHYWRCVVYRHASYGACTDWEWVRPSRPDAVYFDEFYWRTMEEWPKCDHNASDGGIPKGTTKVWEKHRTEIQSALEAGGYRRVT